MISENQFEFRKKYSTINQIRILQKMCWEKVFLDSVPQSFDKGSINKLKRFLQNNLRSYYNHISLTDTLE